MTDEAVDLLEKQIASLPDDEFGVINLLPFAVDSDETNALRRRVCQAIVRVFRDQGYPMDRNVTATEERSVTVNCRQCGTTLLSAPVTKGVANVPAAAMISGMAKLHSECPHRTYTADDQRQAIEQAVLAARGQE